MAALYENRTSEFEFIMSLIMRLNCTFNHISEAKGQLHSNLTDIDKV